LPITTTSDTQGDTTLVAVKIRLKRMGKVRAPYYRIVVADSRTKRDGRVIEEIGKYHPKEDPSFIEVNSERAQYWLGVGAQPSEPVAAILKVTGDWQLFKGEAAPAPMRVAEPRRDKTELFNEALKDSHGELATEAVTARKPAKKAASAEPAAAQAGGDTSAQPAAAQDSEPATAAADPVVSDVPAESTDTETVASTDTESVESTDTESIEAPTDTLGAGGESPAAATASPEAEGAVAPGADAAPASGETDMAAGVAETKAAADDESTGA
jgi:small subunit ribosomal protein S16